MNFKTLKSYLNVINLPTVQYINQRRFSLLHSKFTIPNQNQKEIILPRFLCYYQLGLKNTDL